MTRGVVVAALAIASVSCGVPLMKLPPGPGVPSSDAADVLSRATVTCSGVRTLTAEAAVSGSAGGHRLSGRLLIGVASPASARLEAVAPFGPPMFIFTAEQDDATLLLPRDDRVLRHGRPDAVLEAVTGAPLGAADLRMTLTGCATSDAHVDGRRFGDDWRVVGPSSGDEMFLHRVDGAWRLVAATRRTGAHAWRAEYGDHLNGLPRAIRLVSLDPGGRTGDAFDLRLTLSQVESNVTLDAGVFLVTIPSAARAMTIEELRQSGALAAKADGR
jgi:hypothetical protein